MRRADTARLVLLAAIWGASFLFGVLWGALFLDEALSAPMLAGGALVVLGTVFVLRN